MSQDPVQALLVLPLEEGEMRVLGFLQDPDGGQGPLVLGPRLLVFVRLLCIL